MIRTFVVGVVAVACLFGGAAEARQDTPLKHTSGDPYKCKVCAPALEKALGYLKKNQGDGYRKCLTGFVYMLTGNQKEFDRCVSAVSGGFYKQGGFNGNWALAMAAIFLSEAYKRKPTDKLKGKLIDLLKYASENVETTGGWCHHLEMWKKNNYNKIGGGKDLGVLTCMMFGAMLNMRKCGIEVPDKLFKMTQTNLEANFDGMGVTYGTDNRWGDIAMGRAAWAWLGIDYAKYTATKLYKGIPKGLKSRYKKVDSGHAYPPIHYMAVALAMNLLGPSEYDKFFRFWGDRLIALQKEDGSVKLPHTEGKATQDQDKFVGGTAAFAAILLLQKSNSFKKGGKKGGGSNTSASSGGGIFGGRKRSGDTADGNPYLGLKVKNSGFGVSVLGFSSKSPSKDAGFKEGDLIVAYNGTTFDDLGELRGLIAKSKPGKQAKVTILRAGDKKVIPVKVGAKKKSSLGTATVKGDEI